MPLCLCCGKVQPLAFTEVLECYKALRVGGYADFSSLGPVVDESAFLKGVVEY